MWKITFSTTRLVSRHRGTLPVLLTCPHGGDGKPAGIDKRTGAGLPEDCDFNLDSDLQTRTITTRVAQRLLDVFGEARRAGVLVLYGENGGDFYVWVDNQGKLRISPSDPRHEQSSGDHRWYADMIASVIR